MTAGRYLSDSHPKDWVNYQFSDMHNKLNKTNITYTLLNDLYATATWKAGHGPTATWSPAPAAPTGRYQATNAGDGLPLANFNDPSSRGRGAHQYRADGDFPMSFGRAANWTYRPSE